MNAVLLVTKDRKQTAKAAITGELFIIGRSPKCDLPLDEPLASRQHAGISFEKGAYWIQDRGSRNGTQVNGEKLDGRRLLADGDEIAIGATRMKFLLDVGGRGTGDSGAPDGDETRFASISGTERPAPAREAARARGKGGLEAKVRIVDGPLQGGVFRDWDGPLLIGRSLENHVVLPDDAVSAAHARIVQEGERFYVEDLDSSNGTFLDGVKVRRTELANGQKLKIGASTLVFELTDLRKRRRTLNALLIGTVSVAAIAALIKFLQPPDVAGPHIAAARNYEAQGNLSKAQEEYGVALMVDPNREEAKRGLRQVKNEIANLETLAEAEKAAAAENYDKAKELCYRVLRDAPNMGRAVELEAVLKSIENARVAFTARNWTDAVQLLEKARQAYPKSELIRARLDDARRELIAQQNLSGARDALRQGQPDVAEPLLRSIPPGSVYAGDAAGELARIAQDRQVADHLDKARSSYRGGRLADALAQTGAGLQLSGGNAALLALQERIHRMEPLFGPLQDAEGQNLPDDVDLLLQKRKACNDVIALEADPQNTLNRRAREAGARISAKLLEAAQAYAAKAAETARAGRGIQALPLYDVAIKANPGDQDVVAQRDRIYQQIVDECRKSYQEGIVHADLGQNDLALQAYRHVLAIGIPGEDYYKKAEAKIKAMTQ